MKALREQIDRFLFERLDQCFSNEDLNDLMSIVLAQVEAAKAEIANLTAERDGYKAAVALLTHDASVTDHQLDALRAQVEAAKATARRGALSWAISCVSANGISEGHPAHQALCEEYNR